jgi:tetratricopeptide (TPR) repeat protein
MRKKREKSNQWIWVACLAGLCVLSCLSPTQAEENSELRKLFIEANFSYKDSRYDMAIAQYEKILKGGYENGHLYYNLANSYFKKGDLGKAVLHYERAMLFMPHDSDLKSNYDYVRSLLNLGRQEMPGNRFHRCIDRLFIGASINGLTVFLSFLYLAVMVILSLDLFFKGLTRFSRAILFLLVLLFIPATLSLSRKINYFNNGSIVTSRQADVRFEPSETATTFFKLPEGSLVEILEKTGDWYKIKRSDGKLGWVSVLLIEKIKS